MDVLDEPVKKVARLTEVVKSSLLTIEIALAASIIVKPFGSVAVSNVTM